MGTGTTIRPVAAGCGIGCGGCLLGFVVLLVVGGVVSACGALL